MGLFRLQCFSMNHIYSSSFSSILFYLSLMCTICLSLSSSIGDADILESSFMPIYNLLAEVDCIEVASASMAGAP